MRYSRLLTLALVAGLAAVSRGDTIGSGVLDPVDAGLAALQETLTGLEQTPDVKRDLRLAGGLRRLLLKRKTAKSVANEAAAGAKVAKKSLRFSASDDEIREVVSTARDGHDAMVGVALASIDFLLAQDPPAKNAAKARKKLEKRRDKVAGFDDLADAATDTATAYRWTAKALRAAGAYAGDDGDSFTYVLSSLHVSDQGLDLSGDGQPDNALAGLLELAANFGQTIDIDQVLADQVASGETVTLLDVWALDGTANDPFVWFGLSQGTDTDGDPSDNFSGSETFTYSVALLEDGHTPARAPTAVKKGRFDVSIGGADQEVGGLPIPALGRIRVAGRIAADGVTGTLALALPVDTFLDLVEAATGDAVPPLLAGLIRTAADIDLDGEGGDDAISLAFDFESVQATAVAP